MSLRSLLPIGRAFEPSGERLGRFRPAEPGLLPDFSRVARDGRGVGVGMDEEGEANLPRGEGRPEVKVEEGGVGRWSGKPECESPRLHEVRGASVRELRAVGEVRGSGNGVAEKSGRRLPVWLEQIILMLVRPGNRRRGTRPEQSEFCLQSVKVAKNDLVTSDVEVVAVRSSLSKPQALSASCRARLLALWWAPVARRLGRLGNRTH